MSNTFTIQELKDLFGFEPSSNNMTKEELKSVNDDLRKCYIEQQRYRDILKKDEYEKHIEIINRKRS